MTNKMLKAAAKWIPDIPLPRFFCVRALPQPGTGKTKLALVANVQGERKEFSTTVPSEEPRLSDVLGLFPSIDVADMGGPMLQTALKTIRLPADWKLECTPKTGGFTLALDIYRKGQEAYHQEKFVEVSEMQLRELIDIVDWAKDAYETTRLLQDQK